MGDEWLVAAMKCDVNNDGVLVDLLVVKMGWG